MAEHRQPFRFRLPWLSAVSSPAPAPRPAAPQPLRPAAETRAPAQPTTAVPIQRPPFRPPGTAPESRVASLPTSPSRATRAASVPPSPTRGHGTESRISSQPATPPRATTQTQIPSETKSPPHAPTQTRAASVPPSPSRTASQTQPAIQAAPQPIPPRPTPQPAVQTPAQPISQLRQPTQVQPPPTAQPAIQTSAQPFSQLRPPTQVRPPPRAVSQPPSPPKKPEPLIKETSKPFLGLTQPPSQEPQPKTQIKSEIVSESQYQPARETAFQPDRWAAQIQQAPDQVTATTVAATEPERKSEDEKKFAKEVKKEEKTNGATGEEHAHKTVSEILTAAGTRTKELLGAAFQQGEKQEKQEIFERKKPMTTDEKHIKTVSSMPPTDRKAPGTNGERAPLHKQIKEDVTKFVHKLNIGNQKQPMDGKPISMITLAGENRGAVMHLGSETVKKDEPVPIHRGYKLISGDIPESTTDGEGSSGKRKSKDPRTKEDQTTKAYINSNTQSINNSITFDSSVNEHNPGVHLGVSRNLAEPTESNVKTGPLETHKSEFSATAAERLTYAPTIRRRCLRGLLLEPSDSDPDNPEKPRHHGCLYNCGEKSKDKDLGVL